MATTYTARQTAQAVNAQLSKAGLAKSIDAKRVRAYVRDNVAAFDDDGYTAHLYDARTQAAIVKALVARYTGKATTPSGQRAASASSGRTPRAKGTKGGTKGHTARELAARKRDAQPARESMPAPSGDAAPAS